MQSYMKGERLPFIGHDCTLWRRMFQPEGSSDDRLFFRQISKMIFDKKFDEMLDFASSSPMVKYLLLHLGNEEEKFDDGWIKNYLIALYSFFAGYEELTQLETDEKCISLIEKMCSEFKVYSRISWFQGQYADQNVTVYGHIFGTILPKKVRRYYELTNQGYGYNSMQAGEHCNKTTKVLFKLRTNGKFNLANYDCYASIMNINWHRYTYYELPKARTKGQKLHDIKKQSF